MTPSEKIDQLIAATADWRGRTLAAVRKAILSANKEIAEEWKWMGSPVWEHDGIGDIVKRFYSEYMRFNNTRAPGEEFHAAFYCKSGCHQSVATALGIKAWMKHIHKNVDVNVSYKYGKQHGTRYCNPHRCQWCSSWKGKNNWEFKVVEKALCG